MAYYDQIWLTGFSGTGKSRLARPLAAALDWEAVDLDTVIEEETGDTIPRIFQRGGEGAFRVLEAETLEKAAARESIVIATGGGAVLMESNREIMHRRGFVVCLDARPETILARISAAGEDASERPLLTSDDPLGRIVELKAERQQVYAQADFILQTDDLTPDQITHQVLLAFREKQPAVAPGPV